MPQSNEGKSTYSRADTPAGARIIGGENDTSGPGPEIMAADTLEGDKVVNARGEHLGSLEDIMIDVQRGTVAYAVMSCGGFLGLGDKLFAVPWGALTLDADRHCFVLDVEQKELEGAPGFDKDHWPSMGNAEWARSVHEYYGVDPYWSTGARVM
jgi:sporulation protein YlmC with PRC-barrel domain